MLLSKPIGSQRLGFLLLESHLILHSAILDHPDLSHKTTTHTTANSAVVWVAAIRLFSSLFSNYSSRYN